MHVLAMKHWRLRRQAAAVAAAAAAAAAVVAGAAIRSHGHHVNLWRGKTCKHFPKCIVLQRNVDKKG